MKFWIFLTVLLVWQVYSITINQKFQKYSKKCKFFEINDTSLSSLMEAAKNKALLVYLVNSTNIDQLDKVCAVSKLLDLPQINISAHIFGKANKLTRKLKAKTGFDIRFILKQKIHSFKKRINLKNIVKFVKETWKKHLSLIPLTGKTIDKLLKKHRYIFTIFYRLACKICHDVKTIMKLINFEMPFNFDTLFGEVDVDANPALKTLYAITDIPSLYLFKLGFQLVYKGPLKLKDITSWLYPQLNAAREVKTKKELDEKRSDKFTTVVGYFKNNYKDNVEFRSFLSITDKLRSKVTSLYTFNAEALIDFRFNEYLPFSVLLIPPKSMMFKFEAMCHFMDIEGSEHISDSIYEDYFKNSIFSSFGNYNDESKPIYEKHNPKNYLCVYIFPEEYLKKLKAEGKVTRTFKKLEEVIFESLQNNILSAYSTSDSSEAKELFEQYHLDRTKLNIVCFNQNESAYIYNSYLEIKIDELALFMQLLGQDKQTPHVESESMKYNIDLSSAFKVVGNNFFEMLHSYSRISFMVILPTNRKLANSLKKDIPSLKSFITKHRKQYAIIIGYIDLNKNEIPNADNIGLTNDVLLDGGLFAGAQLDENEKTLTNKYWIKCPDESSMYASLEKCFKDHLYTKKSNDVEGKYPRLIM